MEKLDISRLNRTKRKELIKILHRGQMGYCFNCDRYIALLLWDDVFLDSLLIGNIEVNKVEEKGAWFNFSLSHSSCDEFTHVPLRKIK